MVVEVFLLEGEGGLLLGLESVMLAAPGLGHLHDLEGLLRHSYVRRRHRLHLFVKLGDYPKELVRLLSRELLPAHLFRTQQAATKPKRGVIGKEKEGRVKRHQVKQNK